MLKGSKVMEDDKRVFFFIANRIFSINFIRTCSKGSSKI